MKMRKTKPKSLHKVRYFEGSKIYTYKETKESEWVIADVSLTAYMIVELISDKWMQLPTEDGFVINFIKKEGYETSQVKTKAAHEILNDCIKVQQERGKDYDTQDNQQERSFASVATAFNAITGQSLTPAEVCLVLQIVKDVRQWSQERLHEDSVLDGVSYASLKGEELYKQYKGES